MDTSISAFEISFLHTNLLLILHCVLVGLFDLIEMVK